MFLKIFTISIFITVSTIIHAQNNQPTKQSASQRLQRLETIADIWGKFYLFHPNIIRDDKPVDWHIALESALPILENTKTSEEFSTALNKHLFKVLNTPEVFAFRMPDSISVQNWWSTNYFSLRDSTEFSARRVLPRIQLSRTMQYIDAAHATLRGNPTDTVAMHYLYQTITPNSDQDTLIIDIRIKDAKYDAFALAFIIRSFAPYFVPGSSIARAHKGWNEDTKSMIFWHGQKWLVNPMQTKSMMIQLRNAHSEFEKKGLSPQKTHIVFLINQATLALFREHCSIAQANKNVSMILDSTDYTSVRPLLLTVSAEQYPKDSIGIIAFTDILQTKGIMLGFDEQADSTSISIHKANQLLEIVRQAISKRQSKREQSFSLDMRITSPDTATSNGITPNLSRETRLRGLFKIWTIIKYFYPYLKTASVNWDTVLTHYIPRVEKSHTAQEYYLTMQEFATLLKDSHTQHLIGLNYQDTTNLLVPFNAKKIDGHVLIGKPNQGRWLPDSIIATGNEILSINGQSISEFEEVWRNRIPASTKQAFEKSLYFSLDAVTNALELKKIPLVIKSTTGIHSVEIPMLTFRQYLERRRASEATVKAKLLNDREQPVIELLTGNIGYIKLFALPTSKEKVLDSVITSWEQTSKALIIDLRGYPQMNYRTLLSKFFTKSVKSGLYLTPFLSPRQAFSKALFSEDQDKQMITSQVEITPHPNVRYTRPIIALVNEDLISQAEDFCIYLKNAQRCTFVGTPTTGTDGTISFSLLPGGKRISFTSDEVCYPDGSPFQRIGIIPDVKVTPTVKGFLEGRDEVLEKGIEVLQQLLNKTEPSKPRTKQRK